MNTEISNRAKLTAAQAQLLAEVASDRIWVSRTTRDERSYYVGDDRHPIREDLVRGLADAGLIEAVFWTFAPDRWKLTDSGLAVLRTQVCPVCLRPVTLTAGGRVRAHGHPARRCDGSGADPDRLARELDRPWAR